MYAAKQRTCIVCEVAVVNPDRTTVFFASVVPLPSVFLRRESGGYTNYFVFYLNVILLFSANVVHNVAKSGYAQSGRMIDMFFLQLKVVFFICQVDRIISCFMPLSFFSFFLNSFFILCFFRFLLVFLFPHTLTMNRLDKAEVC